MPDDNEILEARRLRARTQRRLGFAGIGIITLYLITPMLIGAFGGASRGELWDPYTGQRWQPQAETDAACYDEARRLIAEAATLEKLTRTWDQPVREWQAKCRKGHPDLYKLVTDTRGELIARGKKRR